MLNKVRFNQMTTDDMALLNRRYIPNFKPKLEDNYIQLSTTNLRVDKVNENKLKALKTDKKNYVGLVEGVFPSSFMRTKENLVLKIGAQIMTVINDPGRVPSDDGAAQYTSKKYFSHNFLHWALGCRN